jgi:hypothetical protein
LFLRIVLGLGSQYFCTYIYGLLVPLALTSPCDGQAMGEGFDFPAEAEAARKKAAAAACEHDRMRWMHVAQVWQDLGRCAAQVVSIAPKAHAAQTSDRSLRIG